MEKNAFQKLNNLILEKNSRICAGLDPNWNDILKLKKCDNMFLKPQIVLEYCKEYIDSICDIVPALKMNIAFFEEMECAESIYIEAAEYAKEKGLFVIGDVKRADIGSTSEAYAKKFLCEESPFDAITINPYFGTDGVMPFLKIAKENQKGVFILVKTSNKSSAEIQDLELKDGRKVYEAVADLVLDWTKSVDEENFGQYPMIGAVVGATHPKQAEELSMKMEKTFFLVPGYGAQGATADDVAVNFDKFGVGAIINSSRGIMNAYKKDCWKDIYSEKTWKEAAKAEAIRATEEINQAITNK